MVLALQLAHQAPGHTNVAKIIDDSAKDVGLHG
jgi:hypothetical protein